MSTNFSKIRKLQLTDKIEKIKHYLLENAPHTEFENWLNEISDEIRSQRYGLIFEEHREKIDDLLLTHTPVFQEDHSLEIHTNQNINFLIEGDNLPALTVLEKTYQEHIDFIYIDPPYNTKSKEFIYDDTFVAHDDEFKHSKWLSFMKKRLILAHRLLKPQGCMMLSINEEEVFELKILCDEIFGSTNYLTMFSVKVRHESRILKGDKDFHEIIEYLLMYRKSPQFKTVKQSVDNTSIAEYVYQIIEKTGKPETITMDNKKVDVFKPDQYEILKVPASAHHLKKINIRGTLKEANSSGRFFMKHLDRCIGHKMGYLYKVSPMGDDELGYRYFLIPTNPKRINGDYFQGVPLNRKEMKEVPYSNYLDYEKAFNQVGYEGYVAFRNGKKPLKFLEKCFELGGVIRNKDSVVLDFFAGSGSTGHGLMKLNNQDNGRRKFILITNNQNHICRDITYQRIKRVIETHQYQEGLKYYKIEFISNNI